VFDIYMASLPCGNRAMMRLRSCVEVLPCAQGCAKVMASENALQPKQTRTEDDQLLLEALRVGIQQRAKEVKTAAPNASEAESVHATSCGPKPDLFTLTSCCHMEPSSVFPTAGDNENSENSDFASTPGNALAQPAFRRWTAASVPKVGSGESLPSFTELVSGSDASEPVATKIKSKPVLSKSKFASEPVATKPRFKAPSQYSTASSYKDASRFSTGNSCGSTDDEYIIDQVDPHDILAAMNDPVFAQSLWRQLESPGVCSDQQTL